MIQQWRSALREVANLAGYELQTEYESEIVTRIVQDILGKLMCEHLHVDEKLVGMDFRLKKLNSLISVDSKDVRMVGIYGIGGIGKTTIAKVFYNQNSHQFQSSSFLANIREIFKENRGLLRLQKKLLRDAQVLGVNEKLTTFDEGINMIKSRLCHKKVLVILDDVDHWSQLKSLVGKSDWFGKGSKIIITTRNKHLLIEHEMDELYEPPMLNTNEALDLFSQYAFRRNHRHDDYLSLSNHIIYYCQGLPFALKVLGSSLFSKTRLQWQSELDKLAIEPNMDIINVLRISYEGLSNTQKNIFLDIACFFNGEYKDFVIKILDGCGFFAESGIGVLNDRCLLTILDRKLWMHDLIQQLGWEIVREQGYTNIGRRSRLWNFVDVQHILIKKTGTNTIEGIFLDLPKSCQINFTTEALAMMTELRLLKIKSTSDYFGHVDLPRDFEFPSYELRYLYWEGYPLESLPSKFQGTHLIELSMHYSLVKELWRRDELLFPNLTAIELNQSKGLIRTPNFLSTPNLERLILQGCTSLLEVHQSIGDLEKLHLLDLKDCKSLESVPDSICKLKSLETLSLSGCSQVMRLPKHFGPLKNLKVLSLHGCYNCEELPSLLGLCSLNDLELSHCFLRNDAIPVDFWCLSSLQKLNLSGNNFTVIPEGITQLSKLRVLQLGHCYMLQEMPQLPSSIQEVDANSCMSLRNLSTPSRFAREAISPTKTLMETILERIQVALSLSLSLSHSLFVSHLLLALY
ncbi:hypothetical protein PVL29_024528 [Vitis rotundifolia]|nr:hypothetical protein PVL29_024528 [Vitis rotundifolia]